jgi:hypothetical protein
MADGFVAGQAQAAVDVAGGADEAFLPHGREEIKVQAALDHLSANEP